MSTLFSELKRRKVFRVTAAYLVGAWAILEFVSVVTPMLRLPEWAGPLVLVLLTIGFVAAVALSWTFEVTADGLRRTTPTAGPATAVSSRLDWALMVASVAIVAVVSYQQIFARSQRAAEQSVSAATPDGISIAVLPFVNLSGDPEQEFFSDGITEEITSALAKVKGLKVVARTSAFEFKGESKDMREIGRALAAQHLLEGSVRRSGNRVRITGQLIKADDGTHVWTENYDRELTDIFATQDDISRAIAAALRVPLGLMPDEALVARPALDADLHEDYLRARAGWRMRTRPLYGAIQNTIDAMETLVVRQPDYAPAWALLAMAYAGQPSSAGPPAAQASAQELRRRVDMYLPKAEIAGRRATELDPGSGDSYAGLAVALQLRGKFQEAEDLYKKGLAIDPFNPDLLHFYAQALQFSGRLKEAVEIRRRLLSLEPLVPNLEAWAGGLFYEAGQYEAALPLFKKLPELQSLALTYVALGRSGDAADAILSSPAGQIPAAEAAAAVKLLRAPRPAAVPRDLPDFQLDAVYVHVGVPERTFDRRLTVAENSVAAGYHYPRGVVWGAQYPGLRKTERFKALVRKAGLVDYWHARGWPDLCRPVGADDFECD